MHQSTGNEMSDISSTVTVDPDNNGDSVLLTKVMADCQVEDIDSWLQTSLESRASQPESLAVDQLRESSADCLQLLTPSNVVFQKNSLGFVSAASTSPEAVMALADPVSACLAAVHPISQAIISIRWQRQLDTGDHPIGSENSPPKHPGHNQQFPLCNCGEADCVAICDFREIAVGAQMDQKLWRLMLLLGKVYRTLGQAHKDDEQLSRALKAAELTCLACGAMPPESDNTTGGSRRNTLSASTRKSLDDRGKSVLRPSNGTAFELKHTYQSTVNGSVQNVRGRQQGLFWGQMWMFVGDVYVEIQRSVGERDVTSHKQESAIEELVMSQELMKEVKRLKKKIRQLGGSCGMCSLTSCSCQSDRASSGDSDSSCNSNSVE